MENEWVMLSGENGQMQKERLDIREQLEQSHGKVSRR